MSVIGFGSLRVGRVTPCVAILLLLLPAAASAQTTLQVVDRDTGGPVASAQVLVEGLGQALMTSSSGALVLPVDSGTVVVTALGYDTATVRFRAPFQIVRLAPAAIEVEGLRVEVEGGRLEAGMSIFSRRRERYGGVFLDPAQVQLKIEFRATDLFYDIEDVRGSLAPSGERTPISSLGTGCFNYLINKLPARIDPSEHDPWSVWPLSAVEPEDIMAVEIYRYIGEVPEELRRFADGDALCGLIVVWTREAWGPQGGG